MRTFYSLIWYIILPLVCLRLFALSFKNAAYLERVGQRFGLVPKSSSKQATIWIHAVSVGEVMATQSIVKRIQSEFSSHKIIITTGTPTGADTVKRLYGNSVTHYYQPYDIGLFIKRFIKQVNPQLLLVMETELWPNLFHYCNKKSIPVLLINARLSQRSAERYRNFLKLSEPMLACVKAITAQTESDKQNLIQIGANPEDIIVTGSIKFDLQIDQDLISSVDNFKQRQLRARTVWIAASTHKPEESMMMDIHKSLLTQYPGCLLIIVPRHSVRANEIIELLEEKQINYQLRSSQQELQPETQVLLVDTMGELLFFYGVSNIAFIGGSLVEHGGHNPIEAAAFSVPILIGPHDFNFAEIDRNLINNHGAVRVQNAEQLQSSLLTLFNEPEKRQLIGQNAHHYIQQSQGSSKKVWNIISSFLH